MLTPRLALGPHVSSQDTVSVHRPSFYAERFFKFMSNTVFRKNSCESPWPFEQEGPGVWREASRQPRVR